MLYCRERRDVPIAPILAKRLGLMGELVPDLRRWAVMANADFPDAVMELGEMRAAAVPLGLELTELAIRRADDIAPSFHGLKGRVDALYVCVDPLVLAHRTRINELALDTRLPTCTASGNTQQREV